MIQLLPRTEPKRLDMPDAEFERICQRAAREAVIRNAKLGFPAVSSENGQIVFRSPEQVLAKFAAEVAPPNAVDIN
ncbi:MAG: hypothetical protein IAG10_29975 [Planctomycetaceae bacterium]|nr:hypothetical protein [Planctomycetaceae bacterium]